MLARWTRLFVAFATAFAVWAIATPARASGSAPVCDPRGATAIAPAPLLQQPETSIDVGTAQDECSESSGNPCTADDGRPPEPRVPSVSGDSLVLSVVPRVLPATFARPPVHAEVSLGERVGARGRVDRPPRA